MHCATRPPYAHVCHGCEVSVSQNSSTPLGAKRSVWLMKGVGTHAPFAVTRDTNSDPALVMLCAMTRRAAGPPAAPPGTLTFTSGKKGDPSAYAGVPATGYSPRYAHTCRALVSERIFSFVEHTCHALMVP